MALRALQGPAGGSAPVGGSGTSSPSTIPRWTGPSTLGDSGLIDNGSVIYTTARTVGFGTATPTGRLHATQADATVNMLFAGTSMGVRWRFTATESNIEGVDNTGLVAFRPLLLSGSTVALGIAGSAKLSVDNSGNVGIGTASPAARLQVNDTSTTSTTRNIYTGAITAGLGGSIGLGGYWNGTTETMFAYIVGGKDNATNGDYGGHLQFWTRPNGGVYTERARIDSSGNLLVRQRSNASNNAVAFDNTVQNALTVDSGGNIYGTSGTTGMTNGFFYIPAAAGAPTGTPTAVSGRVPMYYDTTNNQFYVYNGAWKKVTLA